LPAGEAAKARSFTLSRWRRLRSARIRFVYCSGDSPSRAAGAPRRGLHGCSFTPLILPRETRNRQQPRRQALPRDANPLRDLLGGGGETRLGLESRLQTELDAKRRPERPKRANAERHLTAPVDGAPIDSIPQKKQALVQSYDDVTGHPHRKAAHVSGLKLERVCTQPRLTSNRRLRHALR